jgi:ribosomal protein S27E
MTDTQAARINRLRMEGKGYKAIATETGLSRDIVRNYCKKHNLSGYASVVSKNMHLMTEGKKACSFCGNIIVQPATGRRKRFCCEKCRRQWWKAHPEAVKKGTKATYELTCNQCGKTFHSYGNKNRKYCSRDCYFKHRFLEEDTGYEVPEV